MNEFDKKYKSEDAKTNWEQFQISLHNDITNLMVSRLRPALTLIGSEEYAATAVVGALGSAVGKFCLFLAKDPHMGLEEINRRAKAFIEDNKDLVDKE